MSPCTTRQHSLAIISSSRNRLEYIYSGAVRPCYHKCILTPPSVHVKLSSLYSYVHRSLLSIRPPYLYIYLPASYVLPSADPSCFPRHSFAVAPAAAACPFRHDCQATDTCTLLAVYRPYPCLLLSFVVLMPVLIVLLSLFVRLFVPVRTSFLFLFALLFCSFSSGLGRARGWG